ncbi:MAG: LPXTG cell wall anchor domain-containing protein [Bacteroidota bacterium]|nr:LPXTG cell wall anchor domain-containing protein [Bacteroidota bacterium]
MKRLFALLMLNILSLPYLITAQDEGTYIDNLNVQDSSYMEQDLLADAEQTSGSNTVVIIVIVVVVVAAVAFLILRKKKK